VLSPSPALAHWPAAGFHSTEAWLFPGITLPLVVAAFLATRRPRTTAEGPLATLFATVAALAATVAAVTTVTGPWRIELATLSLSVSALRKPLAIALYGLALAGISSRSLRAVRKRGSLLAFYLIASAAMAVLALGPGPRAAGMPIWDKAPYWYLLQLPGVSALRAPARFAMLAVFCLALAGALALGRLVEGRGRRGTGLVALAAAGVLWDGWLTLPIREVPADLRVAPPGPVAAVLELPVGGERDTSAMYRGMTHGLPVVNGYSGYVPPHYHALRLGLEREEPGVLGAIREHGPLIVLLDPNVPWAQGTEELVLAEPGVRLAGAEGGRRAYFLPGNPPHPPPALGVRIPLQVARGSRHRGVFDLGEAQGIGGIRLEFGEGISGLPPRVTVEAGAPGRWTTVWDGPVAALAVRGALRDPLRVPVVMETPGAFGRFLRIRVERWTIAEVAAFSPRSPSEADREPHRGLDPPRLELDGR
jgi:hypothetical protein